MATHKTVSGHDIEYEETRELAAFLARLGAVVADPKASVSEAIGLAYSRENPILDQAVFPERGAVTKEVLASPAYAVVSDLIFRKEASAGAYDLEEMAARHTLTVPEVAERLGVRERRPTGHRSAPASLVGPGGAALHRPRGAQVLPGRRARPEAVGRRRA